jgi:predicted metalloprotease
MISRLRGRAPSRRPFTAALAVTVGVALLAGCASATVAGNAVLGTVASAPSSTSTTTTSTSSSAPVTTSAPSTTTKSSTTHTPTSGSTTVQTTSPSTTSTSSNAVPDSAVGLKPNAPQAKLAVSGDGGTKYDTTAKDALDDLYTFYTGIFPQTFDAKFVPPRHLLSYDSNDKNAAVCGTSEYQDANAAYYHPPCDTVAWDRGVLLPELTKDIGVLAPAVVLSHEMGHDVQFQLGVAGDASTIVLEQQADCYAGAYWKWVAEGNSKYFNFNQGEGMRQLLLTLYQGHDPVGSSGQGNEDHGNGFDRTFAVTLGYNQGAKRCSQIDQKEIDARGQEFPFDGLPHNYGNVDITEEMMTSIAAVVNQYFTQTAPGYKAPTLTTFTGKTPPACKGHTGTYPVDYCPATNTVSYNLAELQRIGTPTAGWESVNGDFSAIILMVSRYALAAQAAGHSPVTGTNAGLRALCYAGTWATWMRNPQGADDLQLSPNDLDKAIYEIVSSPLAASDSNGASGATLIDRVTAFGTGVTEPITTCFENYPG